jgi:hypothetical protein
MMMAIRPDTRNRMLSAVKGGASTTIMRAEVKADDHMKAKARPMPIDLKSMMPCPEGVCLQLHAHAPVSSLFQPI